MCDGTSLYVVFFCGLDLALDPACDCLPLETPRPTDLEAGNLAREGELVGGLLVELEKLGYLPDRQDFVGHAPAVSRVP